MSRTYLAKTPRALLALASRDELKGTELKNFAAVGGTVTISTTLTNYTPNSISVGSSVNNRVGRSITIHGVEIGGWFVPSDYSQAVRVIVGVRKSGYAGSPDITVGNTYEGALNIQEAQIKFYQDDYIGFPPTVAATGTSNATIPYSVYVKFGKGINVRYNTLGNISDNMPFVTLASDSGAINHPSFVGHIRYHFTDS